MNRSPRIVAAIVVALLVVVAVLLRQPAGRNDARPSGGALKLIRQRACSDTAPCVVAKGDESRPGVLFDVSEPLSWARIRRQEQEWISYRLVGEGSPPLSAFIDTFGPGHATAVIQKGYGYGPSHPILEAIQHGQVIGRVPVGPLPLEPRVLRRPARGDSRVRVLRRKHDPSTLGDPPLDVILALGPKPWDMVRLAVLETTYAGRSKTGPLQDGLFEKGHMQPMIWIMNGSRFDAVRLQIDSFRFAEVAERLTFHGASLTQVYGKPVFVVPKLLRATTPSGWTITVPTQNDAPRRPLTHPTLDASLIIQCTRSPDSSLSVERMRACRFRLVSPQPEDLGLTSIRAGLPTSSYRAKAVKPVRTGPVTLQIEVVHSEARPVDSFQTVVPVEQSVDIAHSG